MKRALVDSRAGAGVLIWLALAVIAALGIVGIYQRHFTSQITLSVSRSMAGELALAYGQSVIEEAMHQVRLQANDPVSPLYYPLRRPVKKPNDGYLGITRDLKAINIVESKYLAARGPLKSFSATSPLVEVLYQRQFEDLPDERFGLIHYQTRASGTVGASDTISREIHAYQEFRTVIITMPRPFDELPFYVGRASALTNLTEANGHRRSFLELYGQARDALKRAVDLAPAGISKDNYKKMWADVREPAQIAASAREIPEQPDAHVTGIWYATQSYCLESMDIAARLRDALPAAQRAVQAQAAALKSVESSPGDESANFRMMETTADAFALIQREMLRIWGFHFAFRFIPPGLPAYDAYERKAQSRLGYDHWRKIAFFVLHEEPGGGPARRIQAQFDRLLARAANPNSPAPPFNGVVLVENETEPLTLRGDLVGKMVIVTTRGGLKLDNVNPNADLDDSLVAVSLGGTLEMSGTINAFVVAAPYRLGTQTVNPTIRMKPETVVTGGIILPEGAAISEWHGIIKYDDKYYLGEPKNGAGWPDHYYVGVSPRTVFRSVMRK